MFTENEKEEVLGQSMGLEGEEWTGNHGVCICLEGLRALVKTRLCKAVAFK